MLAGMAVQWCDILVFSVVFLVPSLFAGCWQLLHCPVVAWGVSDIIHPTCSLDSLCIVQLFMVSQCWQSQGMLVCCSGSFSCMELVPGHNHDMLLENPTCFIRRVE
jgi:hypothetical protein